MIKLLHLADLHLGRPFRMLGQRGSEQRRALQAALERAVALAISEGVNLVLIAGDLFDSPKPSEGTIQFVTAQLRLLEDAGIRIAIAAGNHDMGPDEYVAAMTHLRDAAPAATFFGPSVESKVFPDLDLTLIGRSALAEGTGSPLSGWPRGRTTRFAIGLAHGSVFRPGVVETPHAIHPHEIRDLGLDYLALGDWHSAAEVLPPPTAAWYPGSPEWLAFDQDRSGHVLLIEIPEPGAARVTEHRVGRRRYERREINAAELDDLMLRRVIEDAADPELVFEVALSGLVPLQRTINTEMLERDLGERFFRLRVLNRTHLWLEDASLENLSDQTVLGRFVRLMRERIAASAEDERPVLEEALQVGAALLSGREVLA
ncbi:MAG: metallophosphoesterase family protein [bacterium]